MGVDAAVYRNLRKYKDSSELSLLDVDGETGRYSPRNPADKRAYTLIDDCGGEEAFYAHIGTVADCGHLRAILYELLPPSALIRRRILPISPGEAEDWRIFVSELGDLETEVAALLESQEARSDVCFAAFIRNLQGLIRAGREQDNPIVIS